MHHSPADAGLYYLTVAIALVMLVLMVDLLRVIKKVDQNLLRARVFLDKKFVLKGIMLGGITCISMILHVVATYFDASFWDALTLLLAICSILVYVNDWHRLIVSAVRAEK